MWDFVAQEVESNPLLNSTFCQRFLGNRLVLGVVEKESGELSNVTTRLAFLTLDEALGVVFPAERAVLEGSPQSPPGGVSRSPSRTLVQRGVRGMKGFADVALPDLRFIVQVSAGQCLDNKM